MTQKELDREVARLTGEEISTIRQFGFSIADPSNVEHDPEPFDFAYDVEAKIIDWDHFDAERRVPLVLQPAA